MALLHRVFVLCVIIVQLAVLDAQFFARTSSARLIPRVRRTQQLPVRDEEVLALETGSGTIIHLELFATAVGGERLFIENVRA